MFGRGGAMLGVPFQSVKDGIFTPFDSTILGADARAATHNGFESEACFEFLHCCWSSLADYHGDLPIH